MQDEGDSQTLSACVWTAPARRGLLSPRRHRPPRGAAQRPLGGHVPAQRTHRGGEAWYGALVQRATAPSTTHSHSAGTRAVGAPSGSSPGTMNSRQVCEGPQPGWAWGAPDVAQWELSRVAPGSPTLLLAPDASPTPASCAPGLWLTLTLPRTWTVATPTLALRDGGARHSQGLGTTWEHDVLVG